jgi:hypothetical protein
MLAQRLRSALQSAVQRPRSGPLVAHTRPVAHGAVGEHRSPTAPAPPPPLEEVPPPEEELPEEDPPEDPPSTESLPEPEEVPEHAGTARLKAGSTKNANVLNLEKISMAPSYAHRSGTRCSPNG